LEIAPVFRSHLLALDRNDVNLEPPRIRRLDRRPTRLVVRLRIFVRHGSNRSKRGLVYAEKIKNIKLNKHLIVVI
jgi:hypothetical protein